MGHPKFIVKETASGNYRFNLTAKNGQVILSSQNYSAKASCLNGVESVRKNSQEEGRFEVLEAKNGEHYFNLKASNGQIIGTSETYKSMASCNNGMKSVATNAPGAELSEE